MGSVRFGLRSTLERAAAVTFLSVAFTTVPLFGIFMALEGVPRVVAGIRLVLQR